MKKPFFLLFALFPLAVQAGVMHPDYPLQTYRDFAENRGLFSPTATNVEIKFTDGTKAGIIPRMMSFESVVDAGHSGLVGDPQMLASVAHNGGYRDVSFTKRFGGDDFYRVIKKNNGWGSQTNYQYDIQVARLDKMVTEVSYTPYMEDEHLLAGLEGKLVLRAGGGTQKKATSNNDAEHIAGAYEYLTGGTVKFSKVIVTEPQNIPDTPASLFKSYQFQYNLRVDRDPSYPLPIGVLGGDSGSPTWAYNEKNKRYEYIGPGQSGGGGHFSQMRGSNAWALKVINSYYNPPIIPVSKEAIVWQGTDSQGEGKLSQGNKSWKYQGLPAGKKFTDASLDELEATRNLIFAGRGGALRINTSIDTGSGTLTFKGNYLVESEKPEYSLNFAGMNIAPNCTVKTTLTSANGDEWRKIGKGTLLVEGSGSNPVQLNIGEGTVILNRKNGTACEQAKLVSGRGKIVLKGEKQLHKPVLFGVRGGVLDMNGHNLEWDTIPHIDLGAIIGNNSPSTPATFTFTGKGAFLGQFTDTAKSRLSIIYNPQEEGASWALQGLIKIRGAFQIKKGHVIIEGVPVPHANHYVDPNDWHTASMTVDSASIEVSPGAQFTLGKHSQVQANILVMEKGTLSLMEQSSWKGRAILQAGAILKMAPSSYNVGRVLDIRGKVTFIPTLPEGTDMSQPILLDIGKLPAKTDAKEIIKSIVISDTPGTQGKNGSWSAGVTQAGVLRIAWVPAKE